MAALFLFPPTPLDKTGLATSNLQQLQLDELQDISIGVAALNSKTAAALVPENHDYIALSYVGATTDIQTVTYKQGGPSGTTVATLTLVYDGSNRLTSVTRS